MSTSGQSSVGGRWKQALAITPSGDLQGATSADGVVKCFRGVPFAQPPVGALRWRAPQRLQPWAGVRPALANGPTSVQAARPKGSISDFGAEPTSEDCLHLNVWSAATEADERRPVMLWIHGGGFYYGSGTLPQFDGANLARRGVVVVTINYRLGPLGFLAQPELDRESPTGVSGNYGFLDQIAALEWVRDHINAFGGDPNRVTVFGQSVGSSSVCCLVASPLTKGLIHRAICQSGGSMSTPGAPGGGSMQTIDQARAAGLEFARRRNARGIEDLRAMAAEIVQSPTAGSGGAVLAAEMANLRLSGWVIIDGHAIPTNVHDIYASGRQNRIPIITGANAHEGSTQPPISSLAAHEAEWRARFGDDLTNAYFEAYRLREASDPEEAARHAMGERGFNWQNWTQLRLHARTSGASAYGYFFSRLQPFPEGASYIENTNGNLGAFHTAEIPFVFDTLTTRNWDWSADDQSIANHMSSYWVNFAATGDPNGDGLPHWPNFRHNDEDVMLFGERASAGPIPNRANLDFWDTHFKVLRSAPER